VICSAFWKTVALLEKVRVSGPCSKSLSNAGKEKVVNSLPPTVLVDVAAWERTAGRAQTMSSARMAVARWSRREVPICAEFAGAKRQRMMRWWKKEGGN
jgi:hypothetical protein